MSTLPTQVPIASAIPYLTIAEKIDYVQHGSSHHCWARWHDCVARTHLQSNFARSGGFSDKVPRHKYDLDENRSRMPDPRSCCNLNTALGRGYFPLFTIDTETTSTASQLCSYRFRGIVGTTRGGSEHDAQQGQAIWTTPSPCEAPIYME